MSENDSGGLDLGPATVAKGPGCGGLWFFRLGLTKIKVIPKGAQGQEEKEDHFKELDFVSERCSCLQSLGLPRPVRNGNNTYAMRILDDYSGCKWRWTERNINVESHDAQEKQPILQLRVERDPSNGYCAKYFWTIAGQHEEELSFEKLDNGKLVQVKTLTGKELFQFKVKAVLAIASFFSQGALVQQALRNISPELGAELLAAL
ncbi:MAG: hypothetical protein Q9162_006502, partial [Coniocarpon cinnabarinum]